MSWIFWMIVGITLLLFLAPLTGVLPAEVNLTFWLIGSLFLVAALIWIVAIVARPVSQSEPAAATP